MGKGTIWKGMEDQRVVSDDLGSEFFISESGAAPLLTVKNGPYGIASIELSDAALCGKLVSRLRQIGYPDEYRRGFGAAVSELSSLAEKARSSLSSIPEGTLAHTISKAWSDALQDAVSKMEHQMNGTPSGAGSSKLGEDEDE